MNKQKFALFLGNIIDHYDTALFAFLSPLFGKLFFPDVSPTAQLVRTFLLYYFAMFFRPFGAYLFGKLGDMGGRSKALSWALIGMGFSSLFIALIPTHADIGPLACWLLLFGRALQNFFSAGESISSSLFAIEKESQKNKDFISGLLSSSTILGILLCSLATSLLFQFQLEEKLWRLLYFFGSSCALFGWLLRSKNMEKPKPILEESFSWINFIAVIIASGFSYCIYIFCFVILRNFLPLIANISEADISWLSTESLLLDLFLLSFFGWLAKRVGRDFVMITAAFLGPLLCLAFSNVLAEATNLVCLLYLTLAVTIGTAYSAPFMAWMSSVLPEGKKGRYGSLAYSLGTQLIGGPAASISFAAYGATEAPGSITYYLVGSGTLAAVLQLYLIRDKLMNRARKLERPFPLFAKLIS